MWKTFEPWQLKQLQRLATLEPARCETFLNTLYNQFPGLLEDLVTMAVEAGDLTAEAASELVDVPVTEILARVQLFRQEEFESGRRVVRDAASQTAKLVEGGVAVWEIVRELRKLGSVERLESAFPTLTRGEIAAALKYAQANPQEIEAHISRYEEVLSLRRGVFTSGR